MSQQVSRTALACTLLFACSLAACGDDASEDEKGARGDTLEHGELVAHIPRPDLSTLLDPCLLLDGASFVSEEELPCNGVPEGEVADACHGSLEFVGTTLTWTYEDIVQELDYTCQAGSISAESDFSDLTNEGTIARDGTLTFEGVVYRQSP